MTIIFLILASKNLLINILKRIHVVLEKNSLSMDYNYEKNIPSNKVLNKIYLVGEKKIIQTNKISIIFYKTFIKVKSQYSKKLKNCFLLLETFKLL